MNILDVMYFDDKKRPVLLILPGGGYSRTSPREAFPVAYEFLELGFHQAIFYYREELLTYPNIIKDSLKHINKLLNDPLIGDIHIIGFSAGGHLAGLLLTMFPTLFKSGILAYPVITNDPKYIHVRSFDNLLHETNINSNFVSIEKRVSKYMPPLYVWHTKEDQSVLYQNSTLLVDELEKNHVEYKFTLFEEGPHGLSLLFDAEVEGKYQKTKKWIDEAKNWLVLHK